MFFVFVGGSGLVSAGLLAATHQHGCGEVFLCVVGCGPRSCASDAGRH